MLRRNSKRLFCILFCSAFIAAGFTVSANAENANFKNRRGTQKTVEKRIEENRAKTDVLYYDRVEKTGIVERNNKIFKIKLKRGRNYDFEELEGYPEGYPGPGMHVQNYPDRLKSIENTGPSRIPPSRERKD